MIVLDKTDVVGWEHAIRGMRNPMNSWDKSDSYHSNDCEFCGSGDYIVGPNDLSLMKKLRNAGTDHRKFMRMIMVYVDITAPLYWWKEFDTYKVGTVANSCSTMHKIHAKEFELSDFSVDNLVGPALQHMYKIIDMLNYYRDLFVNGEELDAACEVPTTRLEVHDMTKKGAWWQMIQLLPSSYNQKRTVMMSYEVLANAYKSRRNHKLDEWHGFCDWVESLPYSELITGGE